MSAALVAALGERGGDNRFADIIRVIHDLNVLDRLHQPRYATFRPVMAPRVGELFRHRSKDNGSTHIFDRPFSKHWPPCSVCESLGIWEEWLKSSGTPCCQQLFQLVDVDSPRGDAAVGLMVLPLDKGTLFASVGEHIPILAGIDIFGNKSYVTNAFSHDGGLVVDGAIVSRSCEVFVLRFDPSLAAEASIKAFGGVDATGPFFWKDLDVSPDDWDSWKYLVSLADRDDSDARGDWSSAASCQYKS